MSGNDWDAYHFAGMDQDSSSNDHAMFRGYSNMAGRWMSPDPYDGSYDPTNPQSFNRYAYVLNSPLSFYDPLGLNCKTFQLDNWTPTTVANANGDGTHTEWSDSISFVTLCPSGSFQTQSNNAGGGGGGPCNSMTSCHKAPSPKVDCSVQACTPAQKAQWCASLHSESSSIGHAGTATGGLSLVASFGGPPGALISGWLGGVSLVQGLESWGIDNEAAAAGCSN